MAGHRQRGARTADHAGEKSRDRRDADREFDHLGQCGAEHGRSERGEYVGRVVGIAEPQSVGPGPRETDGGERGEQVGAEQQHGRDDGGPARRLVAVLGLLVDGDQRVPAPVDEQAQQHRFGQRPEAVERQRVEPGQARRLRPTAGEGGGAEAEQGDQLQTQQHVLDLGGDLQAAVGDGGDDGEDQHRRGDHREVVGRQRVEAEQREQIARADAGQRRHRDDGRDLDDPTAGEPAGVGTEGPGVPHEDGAAVGHLPIEFTKGEGRQQDRHESDRTARRGRDARRP